MTATYLGDPDGADYFAQNANAVPTALKQLLLQTAYPRIPLAERPEGIISGFIREASETWSEEVVNKLVQTYPFALLRTVPMVYNNVRDIRNGKHPQPLPPSCTLILHKGQRIFG